MPGSSERRTRLHGGVETIDSGAVSGWLNGSGEVQGRLAVRVVIGGRMVGQTDVPDGHGAGPRSSTNEAAAAATTWRTPFTVPLDESALRHAIWSSTPDSTDEEVALQVVALVDGGMRPSVTQLPAVDEVSLTRSSHEWADLFGLEADDMELLARPALDGSMSPSADDAEAEPVDDPGLDADSMPEPHVLSFGDLERAIDSLDDRRVQLDGISDWIRRDYRAEMAVRDTRVLSLDVFDTLLLRDDVSEARRFLKMAEEAAARLHSDSETFGMDLLLARVEATRFSYWTRPAIDGHREGSITEIHRMMCASTGLPDTAVDVLREVELDYESRCLSFNPVIAGLAQDFRQDGGTVILVSDMYLDAAAIAELVDRVVPGPRVYDKLYSSADTILSKASGRVFGIVSSDYEIEPAQFLHVGDNIVGDFRRPRESGWRSRLFPVAAAERSRRAEDVTRFVTEMWDRGLDVQGWAKA